MTRMLLNFGMATTAGLSLVFSAQVPTVPPSRPAQSQQQVVPLSRANPSNSPAAAVSVKTNTPKRPLTIVFHRQMEPRQHAFSLLVPDGWTVEGGMFSVDPNQAGGAGNSVDTKCDLAVKREPAGLVMARWLPSYNYADFSGSPEFANLGMLFSPGRVYNGMTVRSLPAVEAFLIEQFKAIHPAVSGFKVLERVELPEVVAICQHLARDLNRQVMAIGKPPMTFTAGALIVEYVENSIRYRAALSTALSDWRAAAALWNNQFTFMMRAPVPEAEQWKPVLDIIRQSLQFNPQWVSQYVRAAGERGETVTETLRYLARIDQEIFERRSKTRSDIQHENYLLLTGQEEYVNPFTKEIERDTADYRHRWTTPGGDRLYTEIEAFDPNRDPALNKLEWKRTPVRPR